MIQTAVACFVGCFAVVVVSSELIGWPAPPPPPRPPARWLRMLGVLLVGVLVTVALAWMVQEAARILSHVAL